ncbi:MAG TPA: 4Fe-4S dicluster domain-containing protein, partial [Elusimicrobiota bacterium]|nr:4Fe-4S dicluster domain-containing protein [Elusimicrobiota bacterium]
ADPILSAGDSSLGELCRDMAAGEVSLLLMLGVNPAYSAPPGAGFAEALARVPFSLHLGLHADETAELCAWHAPMAHPFEAWGDARAFDGTASIQQPLIAPLYGGASAHELLSSASGHEAVRGFWAARGVAGSAWDSAVREGVIPGTRYPARPTPIAAAWRPPRLAAERPSLELCLRPSPAVRDGGAANNPWLQELPDPVTKLTWGDAALLSPRLAARLGVANGDVLALSVEERSLEAPAWVVAGQADETVTLSLGYGRRRGGRWAEGTGASAYVLRSRDGEWRRSGLAARPTGGRRELPCTQGSQEMEGRDLIREGALARGDEENPPPSLYPPMPGGEHAWGMSIDLARCIGCNACVVACQAENNVPWVGPEEVRRGRHMHWLRVDRYYKGDPAEPAGMAFQPVPCMHCEHAPCEEVCPVGATVHSPEGLNEMVYNRCVGTRYCSNNCPYKVRRFNFFRFSTDDAVAQLAANPDVSVRERGVMEKCTYCVQRIQGVRVAAEKEGRPIADGEVITACQAACPSRAIVFGDLRDPKSAVLALRKSPRSYGLLSELGTRPRTTYLARGPA